MSAIAIIPARGGSRRIPGKNIREFHGQPIIAYSIQAAFASDIFDRVLVSTEDLRIAAIAEHYGAKIQYRPPHLAIDAVGTQEVMQEALRGLDALFDHACCIYPCAPMLDPYALQRAAVASRTDYVVPVGTWLQDPGQFYYGPTEAFLQGKPLNSTGTRLLWIDPRTECDINTEADWQRAEIMYLKLKGIKRA